MLSRTNILQRGLRALPVAALALLGAACAEHSPVGERTASTQLPLGQTAVGSVPGGLPARFMLGLFEGTGDNWMGSSGVPWDIRYQYMTKGWVNNWGFSGYDGSYALSYMYDSNDLNTIPAIQYYQIVGEAGGGETAILSKLGNAGTMWNYFNDFKILMQRVKDYGGPVVVLLEADAFAFAQIASEDDPDHYAAIKDSGLSELADLPNTIAGWGMAFLKMKQAVAANNALLGIHVSSWTTNFDVMQNVDVDLQLEVDVGYWYLSKLGLGPNQTGTTFDFMVTDPCDRDAGYYQSLGSDRWWSTSDGAELNTASFNRYAEWLKLWNIKSGKRWMLWQIPVGNSNHLDVYNNGGSREGYKDNRPEYFLGNGTAHISKFADAGVIALLFGAGAGGMSSYANDTFTDSQLFVRSRALALYNAGGLDVTGGVEWEPSDSGPRPPTEGGGPAGHPGTGLDDTFTAQYEWETASMDAWAFDGPITSVTPTTAKPFRGTQSLAVQFNGAAGEARLFVPTPLIAQGTPHVLFHVFVPSNHTFTAIQPYVQEGPFAQYRYTGNWVNIDRLDENAWNLIPMPMPVDVMLPPSEIGIVIQTAGGFNGTVYVDSVGWPADATSVDGSAPGAGNGAGGNSGGGSSANGGTGATSGPAGTSAANGPLDSGCSCRLVNHRSDERFAEWAAAVVFFTLPVWRRRRRSSLRAAT